MPTLIVLTKRRDNKRKDRNRTRTLESKAESD